MAVTISPKLGLEKNFSGKDGADVHAWLAKYSTLADAAGWDQTQKINLISFFLDFPASEWYQQTKVGGF